MNQNTTTPIVKKSKSERIRKLILDFFMITLGAVVAAFAIEEFLVPNVILDGGVVGISIIINRLLPKINLSVLTVALNVPFLLIGSKKMGKTFIAKSAYAMLIFSVFISVFERWSNATDEKLLAVCFGGVILGFGVGIVIRFGGCLDGTETVAILLNKKYGWSVGTVVLVCNVIIYGLAGALFGLNSAMYSLLTYFLTSRILDMVESGMNKAKAAMIITDSANEVATEIYSKLGRTVTIMEGEGLVSGKKEVLYCVLTAFEINDLKDILESIPGSSFVAISDVSEIIGTHMKKRGDINAVSSGTALTEQDIKKSENEEKKLDE